MVNLLFTHSLSFLKKEKKKTKKGRGGGGGGKSQVEWEARHPVSPLQVVSPGQVQGAFHWAPGAGACLVCACSMGK